MDVLEIPTIKSSARSTFICCVSFLALNSFELASGQGPGLHFEISYPAAIHSGPITGRAYVMISRTNDREPRRQIGRTGAPFFGRDIERLASGEAVVIGETDLGSPVPSLREIPPGDYFVQGFINIYSEFRRADGHVVWMHDDQWEGQHFERSPGNLFSDVTKVHLDPDAGYKTQLSARKGASALINFFVFVPPHTSLWQ